MPANKLFVVVVTMNLKTGKEHGSRRINWIDSEDRAWFLRNSIWALRNGYGIQIYSTADRQLAE